MNTGDLFDDPAPPFQRHSETSEAAAVAIMPNVGTLRWKVYARLLRVGPYGATDEEIQEWSGIGPSTERPRRIELVEAGMVKDSGHKRKTRSGRLAVVWIAVTP